MRRFIFRGAALLAMVAVLAVSCGSDTESETSTTASASGVATSAGAKGAPAEIKIGFTAFLSGGASVFGVPAKQAAELIIGQINASGGIGGAQIVPVFIDEAGGADTQVSELRRLALEEKVDLVIGYISSGDCKAVAPVAEELSLLTVLFDCGTPAIFEDADYHYVFRTSAHAGIDNVAAAKYVLKVKPDVKTIAGINQNYSWGQDSWEAFRTAMLALKPDIEVVGEYFPKIYQGQYGAESTALLADAPDVIHSSFWGGDLESFVRENVSRGLFDESLVVFSAGEHMLQNVGTAMPEGVVIGARGNHYFQHPDEVDNPLQKEFVADFSATYGDFPIYPSYHMYQGLAGVKAAFEKAIAGNGDAWPNTEQVITAFEGLSFDSPSGTISMALGNGHQAVEPALYGLTAQEGRYAFATLTDIVVYPADEVNPPAGVNTIDWIKGLGG